MGYNADIDDDNGTDDDVSNDGDGTTGDDLDYDSHGVMGDDVNHYGDGAAYGQRRLRIDGNNVCASAMATMTQPVVMRRCVKRRRRPVTSQEAEAARGREPLVAR